MKGRATVQLGKRSRHRAEDLSNHDSDEDASLNLSATHIGSMNEASKAMAMEETSMQYMPEFT
jgi:hypothetical protein